MSDLEAVNARIPERVKKAIIEEGDERGVSQSTVIREYLEDVYSEDPDSSPGRSTSPLALLGVVSLALAPTLLATGYTAVGSVAGLVAAVYVLLWVTATDTVVEEAFGTAHDELRKAGGVLGFFRHVVSDRPVEETETVVERASRLDMVGLVLLVVGGVVFIPLGAAAWTGVLVDVLEVLGVSGVGAYVLLVVVLGYAGVFALSVSALASLAIATARQSDASVDKSNLPQ